MIEISYSNWYLGDTLAFGQDIEVERVFSPDLLSPAFSFFLAGSLTLFVSEKEEELG